MPASSKHSAQFSVNHPKEFSLKMLNWTNRFNIFCLLDQGSNQQGGHAFDYLLAAGARSEFIAGNCGYLEGLKRFHETHKDWIFGHFAYPLPLDKPEAKPRVHADPAYFFAPQVMLRVAGKEVFIDTWDGSNPADRFREIMGEGIAEAIQGITVPDIRSDLDRDAYISIIESLKKHIRRGDCYEINFCREFYANDITLDLVGLYRRLTALSPNPFSAFYRVHNRYCLCASPERFIRKSGTELISQPIKGTSRRHLQDAEADAAAREYLHQSPKEKSENVMVVDLVRNDMSRVCTEGSVSVRELFGIYAFPQVYQMISTIEGRVGETTHWTDIISACFPMGSMTGAPKRRVMELIDQYEPVPRGLFSGSIGYVSPESDFDFNVVIRSLFYDQDARILSFSAGSGITAYCDAEREFEECEWKAAAIRQMLGAG
ncbi:MAG TPA: aminodeoxychorismate synthase component I [Chitinophagaceae bacterium]|nr:aminodeoxychorismate synthase component I [Chitinophagaceae bacterium]